MSTIAPIDGRMERRLLRDSIKERIDIERDRQDHKWGWPNEGLAGLSRDRKVSILTEEVGEVAKAVLGRFHDNAAHLLRAAAYLGGDV